MAKSINYGIKIAETEYETGRKKIIALTAFKGALVSGFISISEKNYKDWSADLSPNHYWEIATSTVKKDEALETSTNVIIERAELRSRLKRLHYEILFTTELGETTTELQDDYDTLLAQYNPISE